MIATALEGSDPDRASAIKRKILARLTDIERHYRALEAAIAEFADGFDRAAFVAAAGSDDVRALNRVKAVERGLDQLFNYLAELSALGLELAMLRRPDDEANARGDLRLIRDAGVIDHRLCEQLVRVAGIRNRMVHDYVGMSGADVHEAVAILHRELPGYVSGYQAWLRAGFPPR